VEDRHPGHRIGVDRPLTVNFFHAFILHRRVLSFTCLIFWRISLTYLNQGERQWLFQNKHQGFRSIIASRLQRITSMTYQWSWVHDSVMCQKRVLPYLPDLPRSNVRSSTVAQALQTCTL
jgi:hypothetical protein